MCLYVRICAYECIHASVCVCVCVCVCARAAERVYVCMITEELSLKSGQHVRLLHIGMLENIMQICSLVHSITNL